MGVKKAIWEKHSSFEAIRTLLAMIREILRRLGMRNDPEDPEALSDEPLLSREQRRPVSPPRKIPFYPFRHSFPSALPITSRRRATRYGGLEPLPDHVLGVCALAPCFRRQRSKVGFRRYEEDDALHQLILELELEEAMGEELTCE